MPILSIKEKSRRQSWQRNCQNCNQTFGWSKNGDKAKFCSRKCVGKKIGSQPYDRGLLQKYVCQKCETIFHSYYKNRKFCSMKCSQEGREMPRGFGCRVDANHKEIVGALRDVGASIIDTSRLGKGMPDLIVGFRKETFLIEIKNPNTQYGRKGLNKLQTDWASQWNGGCVAIVRSIDDALKLIGVR